MELIEALAQAAWQRDSVTVRHLAQAFIRSQPDFAQLPRPTTQEQDMLIMAAALVELLASRVGQAPPAWTATIGAASEAFYLVAAAESMPRLRQHCMAEAPPPLRQRRLYAPADFLVFV